MDNKMLLLALIFVQLFFNSTASNQGKKKLLSSFLIIYIEFVCWNTFYFYADAKYIIRNNEENLPMLDMNGCIMKDDDPNPGVNYCCSADITNCYTTLSDCSAACNPPSKA